MKSFLIIVLIALASLTAFSQGWQREEESSAARRALFHSMKAFNMPTSETAQQGDFHFGLDHTFTAPVSVGADDLFGFDSPVIMRLELGYSPTDDLVLWLGRSNLDGAFDLQAKYKLLDFGSDQIPVQLALNAGAVYLSKPVILPDEDSRRFQFFGQAIINAMYGKKLGLGLVPSYLYNSYPACHEVQYSFSMGTYVQAYLTDMLSALVEYTPTFSGWRNRYDSFAVGVELETGGHFFKVKLANNTAANMNHYLDGSPAAIRFKDLHIGFHITRTF